MHRDRPRLTRDELVTNITDFYNFLTKFYIPASAIKYPPPDGWPNITPEVTKDCRKSPVVIDLIKHLPYIDDGESEGFVTYIHYKSEVINYSTYTAEHFEEGCIDAGEDSLKEWVERMEEEKVDEDDDEEEEQEEEKSSKTGNDDDIAGEGSNQGSSGPEDEDEEEENWWDGDDPDEIVLSNFISIATGHESGGRELILDVFKGNIHEDMLRCNLLSGVSIEQFFDDLRGKFERLEIVPTPNELEEPQFGGADKVQRYIDIYKKCGWPGEGYRKDEALEKIRECQKVIEKEEDEQMEREDEERERKSKRQKVQILSECAC
jgi:hypothetical protein